jgi:hypothetical protein
VVIIFNRKIVINKKSENMLCPFALKFCFGQTNAGKKMTKRKGGFLIPK